MSPSLHHDFFAFCRRRVICDVEDGNPRQLNRLAIGPAVLLVLETGRVLGVVREIVLELVSVELTCTEVPDRV